MAKIQIDLGECSAEIDFTVYDMYMNTPLGCHAGALGAFNVALQFGPKGAGELVIGGDNKILELYRSKGLYRKLMDALAAGAENGFGDIGGYPKKGHWIISAPWGKHDHSPSTIGTAEIMDLISQFCDREPDKYGHYVMTNPSDCAAHGNNSGFPATRTMVWMPAYVGFSQNSQGRTTRVTGVWTPYVPEPEVPKAVEPAKIVPEIKRQTAEIKVVDDVAPKAFFVPDLWKDMPNRYQRYNWRNRVMEEQDADIIRRLEAKVKVQVQNLPRIEVAKRRAEQTRRPNRIDMDALRRRHGGGWEQRYGNRAR
jgi:hypothetical protein